MILQNYLQAKQRMFSHVMSGSRQTGWIQQQTTCVSAIEQDLVNNRDVNVISCQMLLIGCVIKYVSYI